MSKKKIISVGFYFPGDVVDYVGFNSDTSLLDADIIIYSPNIFEYSHHYDSLYQGKPALNDSASFALQEKTAHWRRELKDACDAGKTIFIFLNKFEEVFVSTGDKQFSGTGRNRVTTNIVKNYDNYQSIPFALDSVNSKGSSMILSKDSALISSYWKTFSESSKYHVYLKGKVSSPLIKTKTGDRTVGAIVRFKSGSGAFILLPYLDTDIDEFEEERDDGSVYWTQAAIEFGTKLRSSLVEISKAIRQSASLTPAPDWVSDEKYDLPNEIKLREKLLKVESKIQKLQKEKQTTKEALIDEGKLKRLLFEKGKPLESSIVDALKVLGFNATQYQDDKSEFDVIFECLEGRLLGEAEGKDGKQININKLRQLEMNIHEDFERDEVKDIAKGVLLGNAFRLLPLEERDENFFTDKCVTASRRNKTALVRTPDLFLVASYLLSHKNKTFAKKCRNTILKSIGGLVKFPNIPKKKEKSLISEK
jgi:hypothetical protein